MQDRFKFRIFINNKIQEVFYFYKSKNGVIFACTDLEDDTGFYIDGSTLMQCTGLKDMNGKLIYEGDILKDKNGALHPISWNFKGFYEADTFAVAGFYNAIQEDMEVIGNIYVDSHLIENSNNLCKNIINRRL